MNLKFEICLTAMEIEVPGSLTKDWNSNPEPEVPILDRSYCWSNTFHAFVV